MPSDAEISALPEANPVDGAFTVVGVQAGVTKRATLAVVQEGIVPVFSRTTTHNDAAIKTLPTTAVELVPAPGAGKMILALGGYVVVDSTAGAYTNVESYTRALFCWTGELGALFGGWLTELFAEAQRTSSTLAPNANVDGNDPPVFLVTGALNLSGLGSAENKPLTLQASQPSGNFTGGNAANTMKVTVLYSIIDV